MARPKKNTDSPQTRDKLIEAARIEFAAQGFSASLEAIAERCGIKRPSLLHHFKSKQALVAVVVENLVGKARERLQLAVGKNDGSSYAERMHNIMKVLRELEEEEKGIGGILLHALLSDDEEHSISQRLKEFVDVIHASATLAGASNSHSSEDMRAAIAQLIMGELARIALADKADNIWGPADGINPMFEAYFLSSENSPV